MILLSVFIFSVREGQTGFALALVLWTGKKEEIILFGRYWCAQGECYLTLT